MYLEDMKIFKERGLEKRRDLLTDMVEGEGEGKRQDKRKRQEKGKVKKKLEKEKERLRRGTSEPGDIVLIL